VVNPIPPLTSRQVEKFWARVDASGDCWEWTGNTTRNGYGMFSMGAVIGSKMAHRVVWQILVDVLPTDLEVDHRCFNPGCVNPDHLEPVTPYENTQRRRHTPWWCKTLRTHCPQGHPYDAANTRVRANGTRNCKACDLDAGRAKRALVAATAPPRKPQPSWQSMKTHCPQGHPYDDVNTYRSPSGKGGRQCKACLRDRTADWVSKKTCSAPDCDRSVVARGMCNRHYKSARKAQRKATSDGAPS
jgi:hypothetical protein